MPPVLFPNRVTRESRRHESRLDSSAPSACRGHCCHRLLEPTSTSFSKRTFFLLCRHTAMRELRNAACRPPGVFLVPADQIPTSDWRGFCSAGLPIRGLCQQSSINKRRATDEFRTKRDNRFWGHFVTKYREIADIAVLARHRRHRKTETHSGGDRSWRWRPP